jgi:ParB-like chromosome segregation protein Spo0J
METGNDKTAGARSLADLIRGIDRKRRPKVDAVRPAGGLPQHANRQIAQIPLARLTASESNARTHSPKQLRQIAASLKRFGFIVPVLVNAENQIVAGHGRVEAAKLLGLAEVPVLRVSHLSAAEQRAFAIADNRLAELAEWDRDTLAIELQGLIELNFDVEVTGFDMGEIELILHDEEDEEADEGETDKTSAEAKTTKSTCSPVVSRCGDVWLLGAHRLDCAEAGDAPAYAAVDAAIRCWQRFTSKSATLAGSGQTFNAIAKERRKRTPARRTNGSAAVQPSSGTA